jgi:hypothetical protein
MLKEITTDAALRRGKAVAEPAYYRLRARSFLEFANCRAENAQCAAPSRMGWGERRGDNLTVIRSYANIISPLRPI